MNLRRVFFSVLLALAGVLALIGGVTLGALSAYDEAAVSTKHRQDSMALMNEVRHEVDLLSRLVSSYVSTANPRFLIYYYDILAIREGSKPQLKLASDTYWEQVIGGVSAYIPPPAGPGVALSERTSQLGFGPGEQAVLRRIYQITDQMKQVEQIAFAATQGLYDPLRREFVSEAKPQRDYANTLLHESRYLKLRADLAMAVDELADQVEQRTTKDLNQAGAKLKNWIIAALLLLLMAMLVLLLAYNYLKTHLLAPLTALHRTATALAEKSFSERVSDVHGVEEVQALASTINSMAAAIEADIEQRELVQRALRQARARAEVAADAKSIFLANMSHEIRTPMNAILGMAYLALKSGLPPRQHDYVSKIHGAARSLLGILNDVLDFSKIEAGKVALESVPFDLEPVVQNALFMVQQRAEGKRIELILDFQQRHNLHHLLGDPLRLGQILINLLSNAVKFTETGHVRLSVSEWASDGATSTIAFRVEDTGIGITPDQVSRLFQEFSQADGSTTRKYGGTGLGLAISKRLVAAMGSQIEVESTVDRGSTFHFVVQLPIAPGAAASGDDLPLNFERALVVDDYPAARESMAGMLATMGCPVVDQSADGAAAVAQLTAAVAAGKPYDLLLLDWLMPDMSGGELIEVLRMRGVPLPAKTIVVSAADAALLRHEANQPGVVDVVQKPLLPNMLRRLCGIGVETEYPERTEYAFPHPGCLQGMPILLVEDNEVNQEVAGEILKGWGASVEIAANGQIALDRLFAQPPEHYAVVLMDIEMPVMDGREATRRLREDERFQNLPIIAMTAHVAGHGMKDSLAKGVSGYIAKPFEPDELLAMVQPYWQGKALPTAAPSSAAESEHDAFIVALTAVPGIESAVLLRRFSGRFPFLARTLRRFAEDCQGWSERLGETLVRGEFEAAQRQVHTLKGLAGTFAMIRLQSALYDLENAIKNGIVEPFGEIAEVDVQMQPVLDGLAKVPAGLPEADGDEDDGAPVEVVLSQLRDHLREGDGEAEELWRQNKGRLGGIYSPRQIALIDHAISQWDFDDALVILAKENQGGSGQ